MSSTWTVPSYSEGWTLPGYTEERELGHGASGRVVRAVHDESGQTVAVKYLSPMLVHDSAFMWGYRADAQMLRELGVPQVVQVYDYVEQPGQGAAIVMELVNGVSLHQVIERQGTIGPEAACTVLKDALLGLAAAHTLGIVHRDYKPENMLVDQAGNTKLVDFGVAVRWGKQAPAAGTPLYLAPEEWHGAPASPATDIYAATAVFYECLTGRPPFSGKLLELQEQHVTASVPLDRIDEPLQSLITRGMAKNPAGRPPSAIALVSELEALAAAVYGPGWEQRGRGELAERAAALLPVLLRDDRPSASTRSYASTWEGGGRKARIITVASIAAVIVVALGAVAGAVALKGGGSGGGSANLSGNSTSQTAAANVASSFSAVANVTPPVRVTACTTPSTFAYNATISSTGQGTMKYQWVYSSGKPGPVQTLSFTGAGKKVVTGETLSLTKAGTGWGKINMVSPTAKTLDEASYQLLCNGSGNSQVSTGPTNSSSTTAPTTAPTKSSPSISPSTSPSPSSSTTPPPPSPTTSSPSILPSLPSSPSPTPTKSSSPPSILPSLPPSSSASPSPSLTVSSSPGTTASATPTLTASASAPPSPSAPATTGIT